MFQLPEEVKKDLKNYKSSLEEVVSGKISPARFKGVRVPWGVYTHRGGKLYMARIRIPAGVVSPSQLRALSFASRRFADGILHLTTREDIQIHNVKMEDTIKIMEYLKEYNLSPRGGGGNTVRNVIACSLSGVCRQEIFDVREDAFALTEYLLRNESSFNLPRKFKISFSGCCRDCAGCLINDLGFIAEIRDGKRGFKVFVGGGLGANSRIGKLLEEFISQKELGFCVCAVKNVFYRTGDRHNRHHNRLRFLIEDMSLEEFRKLYKHEFSRLKKEEYISLRKIEFSRPDTVIGQIPQVEDSRYKEFLKYSVQPQKQDGFVAVELRIPRGDIQAEKLSALADLERDFQDIEFRTSQNQNLILSWIKNEDLHRLFLKLKDILDDFLYPKTLLDVVACKGALTCNLGLCNSPALAREIEDIVKEEFVGKKIFKNLEIKLNGCPNACGHSPLGKLSFYGMVRRVDNRPAPFYKFLLGGRKELEDTSLAEEAGAIPAKNIPGFLKEFLKRLDKDVDENRDIYRFLEGPGRTIALEVLEDYSYLPGYLQDRNFFIDWGREEEFSLAGLGPGECGAGVLDMIEADLTDAKISLEEAEKKDYSAEDIKKALFTCCRALLVVKGIDPKSVEEALSGFKAKFIDEGIASGAYNNIDEIFTELKGKLNVEQRKEKFIYVRRFFEHISSLYKSMDSSFNFPKAERRKEPEQKASHFMDLKGTPCPINYVKIKLELENLDSGEILEVLLDEGEPIESVPKSLQSDGHQILEIKKQNGFYKVIVKKK